MSKITTGISGLDRILLGGIIQGDTVLIQGAPGSGKTTLGLHFIYHGIVECDEPGLVITFEELPQQMYRDAQNFGWDLPTLVEKGKLKVVCTSPSVLQKQMQDPHGMIAQMSRDLGVKRILVDSITHFQRITTEQVQLRDLVNSFLNSVRQGGYTTFLIQEIGHEQPGAVAFEQYVVDAVMRISFEAVDGLNRKRYLEVLKARGQDFLPGKHSLQIGDTGMKVFPIPRPSTRKEEPTEFEAEPARAKTGVAGLDRMLGGGMLETYSTLLIGDSGTGKSSLGLLFLDDGSKNDEPGLLIAFRERPDKICKSASSIGVNLQPRLDSGMLTLLHRSPVNINPDELYWDLRDLLDQKPIKRVVMDSLSDLLPAFNDPARFRDHVASLIDLFGRKGITSLLTFQPAEATGEQELVESELSAVFDTIISMRLRRIQDHMRKTICLLKVRSTDHDTGIRMYKITSDGIWVETKFEGTSSFLRQLKKA